MGLTFGSVRRRGNRPVPGLCLLTDCAAAAAMLQDWQRELMDGMGLKAVTDAQDAGDHAVPGDNRCVTSRGNGHVNP